MLRNGLEPWHLVVVALVVVVLFGAKRLPDAARSLGKSMRVLKSEAKALKDEAAAPTTQTAATAAEAATATTATTAAEDQPAPRTVMAAPGDGASARPVKEHGAASA